MLLQITSFVFLVGKLIGKTEVNETSRGGKEYIFLLGQSQGNQALDSSSNYPNGMLTTPSRNRILQVLGKI